MESQSISADIQYDYTLRLDAQIIGLFVVQEYWKQRKGAFEEAAMSDISDLVHQ